VLNLIEKYGSGIYSCVLDSYDYNKALSELLPSVKQKKLEKGGVFIIRPDSGDAVQTVTDALQ
jgi:nicotinic acid phosphoribosyltransferase